MTEVEVIGVYHIREHKGVALVELIVDAPPQEIDVEVFGQGDPEEGTWEPADDVRYLNAEGTLMMGDAFHPPAGKERLSTRLAFFMHDLDLERPLQTPFGRVPLPKRRPLPTRLRRTIQYHPSE